MNKSPLNTLAPLRPQFSNPIPPKEVVIFIDGDDTLLRSFGTKQIPIPTAIQYVRDVFQAGSTLYLWSRGGAEYSRDVAKSLGIEHCFTGFLPKPDVIVDDRLLQLLDHCEFIHPNNVGFKDSSKDSPKS
jgi:hypothetical protein